MTTVQMPPTEVVADGRVWRIARAWPLGDEPAAGLAVEADAGDGSVAAGLWHGGELELLPVGSDPKLKDLPGLAAKGAVVSHRLRKRAVVKMDGEDGAEFTKVVRAGRAEGILAGIDQARAFEAGFRTPEVLGTTDATVTFAGLPGTSLHVSEEFTDAQWRLAWADVAHAVLRSHGAATPPQDVPARRHGLEDEARVLEQWYQRAADWVKDPTGLRGLVDAAASRLLRLRVPFWAPTHRDLHDKQLLWDPDLGPGLLDVDTACLAHPGLDLGNLRAHAQWRVLQGLWSEDRADVVRAAVDRIAESLGVPPQDVAVFERATLVRIRCVYAFRPGHAEAAQHLQELLG
ncbi:hypothetical protein GCM10028820_10770 [Tessaracoccus terricola]